MFGAEAVSQQNLAWCQLKQYLLKGVFIHQVALALGRFLGPISPPTIYCIILFSASLHSQSLLHDAAKSTLNDKRQESDQ